MRAEKDKKLPRRIGAMMTDPAFPVGLAIIQAVEAQGATVSATAEVCRSALTVLFPDYEIAVTVKKRPLKERKANAKVRGAKTRPV